MDIPQLANDLTITLTPVLPVLMEFGKEMSADAAKRVNQAVIDGAKSIWGRLWPHVKNSPAAEGAAREAATAPDDPDAQAAFRLQLRKILEANPELAEALAPDVAQLKSVVASGDGSVAVGGSANGATIITGDHNRVGGTSSDQRDQTVKGD